MTLSIFFLCASFDATGVLTSLNEAILAQVLIGSHFRVPGLPRSFDYVIDIINQTKMEESFFLQNPTPAQYQI